MYSENFEIINYKSFIKNNFPNSVEEKNFFSVYSSFQEEKNIIKNGVGLRIIEEPVVIKLTGKDTLDFIHRISTNKIKDLQNFQKINTLFLNEKGRFISRSTFACLENEYLIISETDFESRLYSWINKYIIMEDIKTENQSSKYSLLEFIGPQTNTFLTLLIGDELSKIDERDFRKFDVDGFSFFMFFTKENNNQFIYKILIEQNKLIDFYKYLDSIKSVFDLALIGESAYDYYRIKNLIPKFPNEINAETNPHEVNLIYEVDFKKGCYIGQEVIARLDTYDKVQRKLIRAEINSTKNIIDKNLFDDDNFIIGKITTEHLELFNEILCLIKKSSLNGNLELPVNFDEQKIILKLIDADTSK
jgi:folate-binding protein YgfZ